MPWWGWLSIGIVLMGVELTAVDAAFYLIFVGAAAVCVGIIGLAGVDLPVWGPVGWRFAVLAVASMVLFRGKLYDKHPRRGLPGFEYKVAGRVVSVAEDVPSRAVRRGWSSKGQPMDRGQRGPRRRSRPGRPRARGRTETASTCPSRDSRTKPLSTNPEEGR